MCVYASIALLGGHICLYMLTFLSYGTSSSRTRSISPSGGHISASSVENLLLLLLLGEEGILLLLEETYLFLLEEDIFPELGSAWRVSHSLS